MTTYDQLQKQIKKLQEQADSIKDKELASVIAAVKEKIAEYGLTATQLGFRAARKKSAAKTTGRKKRVMYRKGDLTWTGAKRGRRPQWIVDALAAGENIEKYRV